MIWKLKEIYIFRDYVARKLDVSPEKVLSTKKLINLVNCPICGKNIGTNNNKTKYNHLSYCIRHL